MSGDLPIARFLQMESNVSRAFRELNRLMEVTIGHGSAIKEINSNMERFSTKVELSAAVSSIKYNKLSASIRGEAEDAPTSEGDATKQLKELKGYVKKMEAEMSDMESRHQREVMRLNVDLNSANFKLDRLQRSVDALVSRKEAQDLAYLGVSLPSVDDNRSEIDNSNNNNNNNNNNSTSNKVESADNSYFNIGDSNDKTSDEIKSVDLGHLNGSSNGGDGSSSSSIVNINSKSSNESQFESRLSKIEQDLAHMSSHMAHDSSISNNKGRGEVSHRPAVGSSARRKSMSFKGGRKMSLQSVEEMQSSYRWTRKSSKDIEENSLPLTIDHQQEVPRSSRRRKSVSVSSSFQIENKSHKVTQIEGTSADLTNMTHVKSSSNVTTSSNAQSSSDLLLHSKHDDSLDGHTVNKQDKLIDSTNKSSAISTISTGVSSSSLSTLKPSAMINDGRKVIVNSDAVDRPLGNIIEDGNYDEEDEEDDDKSGDIDDSFDVESMLLTMETNLSKLTAKTEINSKYIDEIKGVLKLVDFEHNKILNYMCEFNNNQRDNEATIYHSLDQVSNLVGTCFQLIEKQSASSFQSKACIQEVELRLSEVDKQVKEVEKFGGDLNNRLQDYIKKGELAQNVSKVTPVAAKPKETNKKVIDPKTAMDPILGLLPDLMDIDQILGSEDTVSVDIDLLLKYLRHFSLQYKEIMGKFQVLSDNYSSLLSIKAIENAKIGSSGSPHRRLLSPSRVTIGGDAIISSIDGHHSTSQEQPCQTARSSTSTASRQAKPHDVIITSNIHSDDKHGHIYNHGSGSEHALRKDSIPLASSEHINSANAALNRGRSAVSASTNRITSSASAIHGQAQSAASSGEDIIKRTSTPAVALMNELSAAIRQPISRQGNSSSSSNKSSKGECDSNNNSNSSNNRISSSPRMDHNTKLDSTTSAETQGRDLESTGKLSVYEDIGQEDFVAIDIKGDDFDLIGGNLDNLVNFIENVTLQSDFDKNLTIQSIRMDINYIKNKLALLTKEESSEKNKIHSYINNDMKTNQLKLIDTVGSDIPISSSNSDFPPNALKPKRAPVNTGQQGSSSNHSINATATSINEQQYQPPASAPANSFHGDKDVELDTSIRGPTQIVLDDSLVLSDKSIKSGDSAIVSNRSNIRKMFEKKGLKSDRSLLGQDSPRVSNGGAAVKPAGSINNSNIINSSNSININSSSNTLGEMALKLELLAGQGIPPDNQSNVNAIDLNQNLNANLVNNQRGYMGNFPPSSLRAEHATKK